MAIRRALGCSLLVLLLPATARSQAWLPRPGEAVFTVNYQWLQADDHLFGDSVLGSELTPLELRRGRDFTSTVQDYGPVTSHAVIFDGDVGITDRLALSGGLAFVQAKWVQGGYGLQENPTVDDGAYHGSLQDARIGARFVALDSDWKLTPSASFIFPTRDYPVFGHAAIGRGLNELQLGMNFGRLLSIYSARAYVQGHYFYALMENPSDEISVDRSFLQMDLGFFYRAVTFQVSGIWQRVHGGIDWAQDIGPHVQTSLLRAHDQAAAATDFHMGGSVWFELTETTDVYVAVNQTLWGANTHAGTTLTFGFNVGARLWGGHGLGVWQDAEGADSEMDDWLLEDLDEPDTKKKPEGESP